jgi:Ca2+-binding EF-hand superfamily protein
MGKDSIMKLNKMITLIAATGMFLVGQAYAQEAPAASKAGHMMKADTDQDGKISRDEFRAAQEARGDKRFQRLDANNDGFIDKAERMAVVGKKCADRQRNKAGKGEQS